jgi:lipoprotein-releasing system permease protein
VVRSVPYVKHVQPVAFKNGLLKTDTENEGMMLKGVDSGYDFGFLSAHLISGKLPLFTAGEPSKEILISESLADRLGISAGDRITAWFVSQHTEYDSVAETEVVKSDQRSRRFTVCGIFSTGFAEYDDRLCIGDIRQLRKINYWPDNAAGSYEITLTDFGRVEEVREQLFDVLGFAYQVNTVKELFSSIFLWLDKLDVNGIIIIVLMVLVAVVNMVTALLILILERSAMIGLLKAMGLPNVSARRIFLRVSLRLTTRGLLWGNAAGLALIFIQEKFSLVSLDSATYYVDHVAVDLSWMHFIILNVGTFLTCVAMLWLPTLIIGRLSPVKTLKWD